jgi:hypothetical protein
VRETDFSAVHLSGNLPGCCARERQIESQQRLTPKEKSGSGAAHAAVPKTSSRDEIGRATRRTKTRPGEGKNLREDQSRDQEKQRQHTKKLAQDQTAHEQNLAATKRYKQRKITKDEIRRKPRQHTKKLAQAVHHTNKILQRPRDTNREKSQKQRTTHMIGKNMIFSLK